MARIGKITIYVEQTGKNQTQRVRTSGKIGTTSLNTIVSDTQFNTQSPHDTAHNFWTDVLTKAQTQV